MTQNNNLYDRVERVLGSEALKKLQQSKVLIVGFSGLGAEIAKNLILTGVGQTNQKGHITIIDSAPCSWMDLSSHFYLTENDVGKPRLSCIDKFKELNEYVNILYFNEYTDDMLKDHDAVCFADDQTFNLVDVNKKCRQYGTKFISCESRGLFASIFCDFGDEFIINDQDGEEPITHIISNITNSNPGIVTVHTDKHNHGLGDGDIVRLERVEGSSELNNKEFKIKVTDKHTFSLEMDTSSYSPYVRGGYVHQIKKPVKLTHLSLEQAVLKPTFLEYDLGKLDRSKLIHTLFQLKHTYNDNSCNDNFLSKLDENDHDFAKKFLQVYDGNLNPMATFIGGFVAQEIMKACSGKYTPLSQWFYYDALECLPKNITNCEPLNSRYDGQIVVFGQDFQNQIEDTKLFMVGVGALGCEYLKNFAMLGVGRANNVTCTGKITITDPDAIELSNLSRQFLFRPRHIGRLKSTSAQESINQMNKVKIQALDEKVCPETENVFDDVFWDDVDCVVNALDNIKARRYVDSKCVFHQKPLIEAGTMGPKGNTQLVYPHLTESYGVSRDPPDNSALLCTLRHFPNMIEHTIEWARDKFEEYFNNIPSDVNAYLGDQTTTFLDNLNNNTKLETMRKINDNIIPFDFDKCVEWSRLLFEELYSNNVAQLLHNFPLNHQRSNGTPFWGGPKKPPTVIKFDVNNKKHLAFIRHASHLKAEIHNVPNNVPNNVSAHDNYDYITTLNKMVIPEFKPKSVLIPENDEALKNQADNSDDDDDSDDLEIEKLSLQLNKMSLNDGKLLTQLYFEKDDDTNHHVAFINLSSNLRAENYGIPKADFKKTKGVAGNIIPAMLTTTALITGLGTLELYKIIKYKSMDRKDYNLEDFKNSYVNLALPMCVQSDPIKPAKIEQESNTTFKSITQWDFIETPHLTLSDFIQHFKTKYNLNINMLSGTSSILYGFSPDKDEQRLGKYITEIITEIKNQKSFGKYLALEAVCSDIDTNEDVEIPPIKYKTR
jgi:ubiquitin-activating enzyme E1